MSRWASTRCSPGDHFPSWRATAVRSTACICAARRCIRVAASSVPVGARRPECCSPTGGRRPGVGRPGASRTASAASPASSGVPVQPQTGERIAHYQLQTRLATGGMGVIYRAFDERTKRLVALKVLSAQFGSDPDYRARFAQEAELAARVEHPNIVPIYDVGGYPNLYIAMRLVPGTDLASVLREGPLQPERVLDIAESVAGALDEAHRNSMVHRDVKPGNVLLAPTRDRHRAEHVYLTDFGIARSLSSELRLSKPVVVLGSPAYMAPERLAGQPGGPSCDVYGLACVMYECFTGQRPGPPNAPPEEINRRQAVDPPRLLSLRPDLPPALDDALRRAMDRDPRQRPATAGDLAAAARSAFHDSRGSGGSGTARIGGVSTTAPYARPGLPPPSAPPPSAPPPRSAPHHGPLAGQFPPPPGHPFPPPPRSPAAAPAGRRRSRRAERRLRRAAPRRRRRLLPVALVLIVLLAVLAGVLAVRGSGAESDATRALKARLPAEVYGKCSGVDGGKGVTAALSCDGRDPRVARLEVRQVANTQVLTNRFAALTADRGLVARRCAGEPGNSGGFWTRDGARQGAFACYTGADQRRRLQWQYDAQSIEVTAVGGANGGDGGAAAAAGLYDWWISAARDRPIR